MRLPISQRPDGSGRPAAYRSNVFVPEHRTYALLGPKGAMEGVTRKGHQDEELYRCPFGILPNNTLRARARHDCAVVARETRAVVDVLARWGGASGAAEGSLLNRLYRDISTASLHGDTSTATTHESYGAALLGDIAQA